LWSHKIASNSSSSRTRKVSRHQFVIKQSGTLGNYAHVNQFAPD
jgi:hypothetical protein